MVKTDNAPRIPVSPTKTGKAWKKRLKRAETRRKRAMPDIAELRALYVSVYEQRDKWGVSIPIGRTLINSIVSDTYLRNPDPWIQSRQPTADKDFEIKLRDLAKMNLDQTETAKIMRQGMIINSYAGIAGHWTELVQEDSLEDRTEEDTEDDDDKDPSIPEGKKLVVDKQELRGRLLLPHEFLVDPDCNEWNLIDAKWIAVQYNRTREQFKSDRRISAKNLAKLLSWADQQPVRKSESGPGIESVSSFDEKDDNYRPIFVWAIWSRVEKKVVHIPVGADFDFLAHDWPEAWAEAEKYPLTVIAFPEDWQPPDERGNGGFYALPALRKVRSPLENLPRLEAVYLDTVTNKVRKYLSIEGLLTNPAKAEFQSDKNRQIIDVDLATVIKKYGLSEIDLTKIDLNNLIVRMNQDDAKDISQALEAIEHELELTYKLLGIGPSERAGMVKTNSATENLGIQHRLANWTEGRVEAGAEIADEICMKQFIALKSATEPIRYLRAVGMSRQTWAAFPAEDLWDIDILVKHHVGTSRPPDRETVKAERREVFQLIAPVLQAIGRNNKVFQALSWLIEPYDQDMATKLVDSGLDDLAMQMEVMIDQFREGMLDPADKNAATQLLELLSKFLSDYLSDSQHQQVAEMVVRSIGSKNQAPAKGGMGSLPAAKSSGAKEFAAGRARAGAVGGRS